MAGQPSRRARIVRARLAARRPRDWARTRLLDFRMEVTLDGETLTSGGDQGVAGEVRWARAGSRTLGGGRPRTAQADDRALRQGRARRAVESGLSFGEAMRMLAGADVAADAVADRPAILVASGRRPWLAETLKGLRSPEGLAHVDPGAALKGTLGPISRWVCAGSTCSRSSVLGLALPTTWDSARPSRSCRFCSCSRDQTEGQRGSRACWWRPLRFSPIGPRKLSASRRA